MSNHPIHIKKSIVYSQGIRIVRKCSEDIDRERELTDMFQKFRNRLYDESILVAVSEKLNQISRLNTLPKRNLLISYLRLHNPELLNLLNILVQLYRYHAM